MDHFHKNLIHNQRQLTNSPPINLLSLVLPASHPISLPILLHSNLPLHNPSLRINHLRMEQVRHLARSAAIKVHHHTHLHNLEGCQIVHLVYLQLQVCHSDLPSPHLHFLRIKCNKCIKVLLHLVTGEPMGGRVQNRTQLCHQLILTLKAFLELMRLTLRLWMTWFQAPLEKLMTLTSSSGWPRQVLNHRRREKHRHPPKHQILPLRQHQRSSPTLPRSPNRARRSPRKRSPLRWYIPTMT